MQIKIEHDPPRVVVRNPRRIHIEPFLLEHKSTPYLFRYTPCITCKSFFPERNKEMSGDLRHFSGRYRDWKSRSKQAILFLIVSGEIYPSKFPIFSRMVLPWVRVEVALSTRKALTIRYALLAVWSDGVPIIPNGHIIGGFATYAPNLWVYTLVSCR